MFQKLSNYSTGVIFIRVDLRARFQDIHSRPLRLPHAHQFNHHPVILVHLPPFHPSLSRSNVENGEPFSKRCVLYDPVLQYGFVILSPAKK